MADPQTVTPDYVAGAFYDAVRKGQPDALQFMDKMESKHKDGISREELARELDREFGLSQFIPEGSTVSWTAPEPSGGFLQAVPKLLGRGLLQGESGWENLLANTTDLISKVAPGGPPGYSAKEALQTASRGFRSASEASGKQAEALPAPQGVGQMVVSGAPRAAIGIVPYLLGPGGRVASAITAGGVGAVEAADKGPWEAAKSAAINAALVGAGFPLGEKAIAKPLGVVLPKAAAEFVGRPIGAGAVTAGVSALSGANPEEIVSEALTMGGLAGVLGGRPKFELRIPKPTATGKPAPVPTAEVAPPPTAAAGAPAIAPVDPLIPWRTKAEQIAQTKNAKGQPASITAARLAAAMGKSLTDPIEGKEVRDALAKLQAEGSVNALGAFVPKATPTSAPAPTVAAAPGAAPQTSAPVPFPVNGTPEQKAFWARQYASLEAGIEPQYGRAAVPLGPSAPAPTPSVEITSDTRTSTSAPAPVNPDLARLVPNAGEKFAVWMKRVKAEFPDTVKGIDRDGLQFLYQKHKPGSVLLSPSAAAPPPSPAAPSTAGPVASTPPASPQATVTPAPPARSLSIADQIAAVVKGEGGEANYTELFNRFKEGLKRFGSEETGTLDPNQIKTLFDTWVSKFRGAVEPWRPASRYGEPPPEERGPAKYPSGIAWLERPPEATAEVPAAPVVEAPAGQIAKPREQYRPTSLSTQRPQHIFDAALNTRVEPPPVEGALPPPVLTPEGRLSYLRKTYPWSAAPEPALRPEAEALYYADLLDLGFTERARTHETPANQETFTRPTADGAIEIQVNPETKDWVAYKHFEGPPGPNPNKARLTLDYGQGDAGLVALAERLQKTELPPAPETLAAPRYIGEPTLRAVTGEEPSTTSAPVPIPFSEVMEEAIIKSTATAQTLREQAIPEAERVAETLRQVGEQFSQQAKEQRTNARARLLLSKAQELLIERAASKDPAVQDKLLTKVKRLQKLWQGTYTPRGEAKRLRKAAKLEGDATTAIEDADAYLAKVRGEQEADLSEKITQYPPVLPATGEYPPEKLLGLYTAITEHPPGEILRDKFTAAGIPIPEPKAPAPAEKVKMGRPPSAYKFQGNAATTGLAMVDASGEPTGIIIRKQGNKLIISRNQQELARFGKVSIAKAKALDLQARFDKSSGKSAPVPVRPTVRASAPTPVFASPEAENISRAVETVLPEPVTPVAPTPEGVRITSEPRTSAPAPGLMPGQTYTAARGSDELGILSGDRLTYIGREGKRARFRDADTGSVVGIEATEQELLPVFGEQPMVPPPISEEKRASQRGSFSLRPSGEPAPPPAAEAGRPMSWADAEKDAIQKAIQFTGGNIKAAAQHLGMGRTSIYRKMQQYGIDFMRSEAGR